MDAEMTPIVSRRFVFAPVLVGLLLALTACKRALRATLQHTGSERKRTERREMLSENLRSRSADASSIAPGSCRMKAFTPAIWVATCASLLACTPAEHAEQYSWREEVTLSDGRIITVERAATWDEVRPRDKSRSYVVRSHTIGFPKESGRAPVPTWHALYENVLLLDVDPSTGEYFLVTYPRICRRHAQAGWPRPPYIEHRLRDGEWTQVPFAAEHLGRRANMLVYPRPSREIQGRNTTPTGKLVDDARLPGCG